MVRAIKKSLEDDIKKNWDTMPPQLKPFLLNEHGATNPFKLATFWSSPMMAEYTHGKHGLRLRDTSWFLATQYWKLDMIHYTRRLLLNGFFLQQCMLKPIEEIVKILMSGEDVLVSLSSFAQGVHAIQTPQTIERFLRNCQRDCPRLFNPKDSIDFVSQISDDWKSSSSTKKQRPTSKTSNGAQMQIHFDDDSNKKQRHSFNIVSSTTLKSLFKEYAENRGIPLRSLRFSHRDRTLFLSSAGNKTPDALGVHDQDVIYVYDISASQEPRTVNLSGTNSLTSKRAKAKSQRNLKKVKAKIKEKTPSRQGEPTKTLEEWKAQHSRVLTKLHEEVRPQLRDIRKRLNEMNLKCQPPKQKEENKRKNKIKAHNANSHILPNSMIGGKAGKPYFIIHVGEAKNLYSTTKKFHLHQSHARTAIDLHGYTKSEALDALNEELPEWMDTAMKGEYPWVIAVKVVCGCGNQILSDMVKDWIKSTRTVSNAPKNSIV
eukprot:CAMPEP_0172301010 /NCGR_PEP_ID=MMETSP1058-20130122/2995_1 /TAXON_ID=83371 /ORGANISM="Detonula confervacea, Strain CCMP 353" /LENGTH=486 /DNA_ID=CAMNT_0013010995 /DNA_START=258 /DNA_END=1718 /DNA_ORIENTATION=-